MNHPVPWGHRVAYRRKQLGMTQRDLAKRLGVSQPMVARMERHTKRPKVDTIRAIEDILGGIPV